MTGIIKTRVFKNIKLTLRIVFRYQWFYVSTYYNTIHSGFFTFFLKLFNLYSIDCLAWWRRATKMIPLCLRQKNDKGNTVLDACTFYQSGRSPRENFPARASAIFFSDFFRRPHPTSRCIILYSGGIRIFSRWIFFFSCPHNTTPPHFRYLFLYTMIAYNFCNCQMSRHDYFCV